MSDTPIGILNEVIGEWLSAEAIIASETTIANEYDQAQAEWESKAKNWRIRMVACLDQLLGMGEEHKENWVEARLIGGPRDGDIWKNVLAIRYIFPGRGFYRLIQEREGERRIAIWTDDKRC